MGLYDALISAVARLGGVLSPRWAREYLAAHRALRAYDAGKVGGLDRGWAPTLRTADAEIGPDWRLVTNKARDLVRNNPFVSSAIRRYVAYTVGGALWPQARVRTPDGSALNKPLCSKIEDAWANWANACCVDGKDWEDLKKLVCRHFLTDGEVLVRMVSTPDLPLGLQILEADQLDPDVDGVQKNGNRATRGVEVDRFGRPVAYHLLDAHPGDNLVFSTKTTRVLAGDVLHIYDPERITETRGICRFVSAIVSTFAHDQQKKAVMDLLRIAAAYGIFVESDYPEDWTFGMDSEAIATTSGGSTVNQPLTYVNPAGIHYVRKGEKVVATKPEQPTTSYKDFEQSHLRGSAAGFGLSYETYTGDLSNVNYSSLRGGQVNERQEFRLVSDLFIRKLCLPVYRRWLDTAVLSRALALPGFYSRRAEYLRVSWSLPGLPSMDPEKEERSDAAALANGTTTRRIICERKGLDLDEVLDELEAEKATMKEKGLLVAPTPAPVPVELSEEENGKETLPS